MKLMIAIASMATMVAAVPASAQTANADIQLTANVNKACGVGSQRSNVNVDPGYSQDDIIVNLADGNGQFAGQEFTNRSLGNIWCNGPATVTLTATALKNTTTVGDTGSFVNSFDLEMNGGIVAYLRSDYKTYVLATKNGTGGTISLTNNIGGAFETGTQRFSSFDSIRVLKDATNRRPIAGTYNGSITFTATAN